LCRHKQNGSSAFSVSSPLGGLILAHNRMNILLYCNPARAVFPAVQAAGTSRSYIMCKQNIVLVTTLLLAGLAAFPPAVAGGSYTDTPSRDIDMCIAEVRARADFTEAARVRYDVSTTRRSVGYAIGIRTTVYAPGSGAVLREYESLCIATGGGSPSRFEMAARN
jgi:hypothetical protein